MYQNYYSGKVALVTGGGSGIGRALCLELASAGAWVICTDVDPDKADETVKLISDDKAVARKLDVTSLQNFETVISEIIGSYQKLDIIFNNAGIAVSGELRDTNVGHWKKILDINLVGVINGSQTAYGQMLKQGSGQIVNIASGAGLMGSLALLSTYSVTKHAVVNYTEILRLEAKELGIKANVVCPGFISSSIGSNGLYINTKPSWAEEAQKQVGKGITTQDAARRILTGVAKNKAVIIFPFEVKAILFLSKLFKRLFKIIVQKQLSNFRKNFRINS